MVGEREGRESRGGKLKNNECYEVQEIQQVHQ